VSKSNTGSLPLRGILPVITQSVKFSFMKTEQLLMTSPTFRHWGRLFRARNGAEFLGNKQTYTLAGVARSHLYRPIGTRCTDKLHTSGLPILLTCDLLHSTSIQSMVPRLRHVYQIRRPYAVIFIARRYA